MAVNRFTNGAGGNTWNTAGNWSLGSIPTVSDGHVTTFDGTSPNCTMGGARSCNAIDFTGYTNTLTMGTNTLTVAGNVTLDTGLLISGSGAMTINATSTITSNGRSWPNNMNWTGGSTTKTLSGDFTISGTLTVSAGQQTLAQTSAEILNVNGLTIGTASRISGTSVIVIKSGTWTCGSSASVGTNLKFDGNITVSGTVEFGSETLTYVSGTITTGTSILSLTMSCTLDTNGISWYDILFSQSGQTYTINSLLTATNQIDNTQVGTYTFTGTAGFICKNLIITATGASTITLKDGITYTIESLFEAYLSRLGSHVQFTSSHGTNKTNLTLKFGNICKCSADFTRVDASGGRTIRTFNGTITDCVNVVSITDLKTVAG